MRKEWDFVVRTKLSPEARQQQALRKTNMQKWHPGVCKCMQEQGLHTFLQLWEKMLPFKQARPDLYGAISYNNAHSAISRNSPFLPNAKDYKKVSYLIAAGLGKMPEEIFGPIPSKTSESDIRPGNDPTPR